MKVHYLFSRNRKCGSRLIAWASSLLIKNLEKVPSHVAILLDNNFVMESTLTTGVRCVPYKAWLKINEECYKIPCEQPDRTSDEVSEALESIWGKKYDWGGIIFFGVCFVKHLIFKSKFPNNNLWQSKSKFFCTEFAGRLSGYEKHSMTTPAKMCSDFLKGN